MLSPQCSDDFRPALHAHLRRGDCLKGHHEMGEGHLRGVGDEQVGMVAVGLERVEGGVVAHADLIKCFPEASRHSLAHDLAPVFRDENNVGVELVGHMPSGSEFFRAHWPMVHKDWRPTATLNCMASDQIRTAIRPVVLTGDDYRRAHEAAHLAAGLWNRAVEWTREEWGAGRKPGKYNIQKFLTALPAGERPLHAHTTEMTAHDLWDAIQTSRALRRQGIKTRAPWRHKNYRPLSFSKGFGWRIAPDGRLNLSLGRGRPGLRLPLPEVLDPSTGSPVPPALWGEIHLCWDQDARQWSLHIPYETVREGSEGQNLIAIDEGIINPMALATWAGDKTIEVTVINGREARAIKRGRNKAVGKIQKKLSKMKNGSKRHRRLVAAKKRVKAKATGQLRDFDHQVARKAADFVVGRQALRIVAGDVRGIERKTKKERRAGRHLRQQLSQWSRGTQERYLAEKTGLEIEHVNESGSTKTCPKCLTSNRPSGRHYRCHNPACGFTCHRDAVGAINILQKAIHGEYLPIGPDTEIRVTYLRAVERWSTDQRQAHRLVQRRKARALSIAPNRALSQATAGSERVLANPSTGASASGPLAAVA